MMMTTKAGIATTSLALLSACASVSRDAAFAPVNQELTERTQHRVEWRQGSVEDEAVAAQLDAMLSGMLTADRAVQVALLNNPTLQATFEEVGISQANVVQAGLLSNPVFHAELLWVRDDDVRNYDAGVSLNFLRVFTRSLRQRVARDELVAAQLRVTDEVLRLSFDVRRAFIALQASAQSAQALQRVVQATEAAVYAARKLRDAGNITDLDLANQQALHEESRLLLAMVEAEVMAGREQLNILMGLWGLQTQWRMDDELAALPPQEVDLTRLEARVIEANLALRGIRSDLQSVARQLGLERSTRLLPEFDLGYVFERDDGEKADGISLGLQIPIFDFGQGRAIRGRAQLRRVQQRYLAQAIEIRARTRLARERLKLERARVMHLRDVMLPLGQRTVGANLLQYNAMQIGVFRLLNAQERQIRLAQRYIEALRDYWMARTDIDALLSGHFPENNLTVVVGGGASAAMPAADSGGH